MDVQCFPSGCLCRISLFTDQWKLWKLVCEARLKMKKPALNLAALNKLSNRRLAVLTFSFLPPFFFFSQFSLLFQAALCISQHLLLKKSPMKADAVLL